MSDRSTEQQLMDGTVWGEFCDSLKEAGRLVMRPETPDDPFNRLLGYRFLAQLLRAGLESSLDYADPQYPAFFRLADETKKMLNDNPDNYYQNCVIDGNFDYRITGTRGTVNWFSLGTKGNAADVGTMVNTGDIDSNNMTFNPDGSFEIIASSKKQPGNWLPMTAETRFMVVRQTFGERAKEAIAQLHIECLNPDRLNNNPDQQKLEAGLQNAVRFVNSTTAMTIDWMERYRKHLNRLPEDDQERCQNAGGDPNIHYYQSYWKLAPDEALYVRIDKVPECQTWNLQLSNYWMQSLDYRFFRVCVNKFDAHYEDDGSVIMVIAHEDPGPNYPNWLNTCGHDQGGMLGRFVGSKNPPSEMHAEVVKLAELQRK